MKNIKLTKIIECILILVSLFEITPIVANAEWKKDNNGWLNTEGNSWSIGWCYIESNWYYFDSKGYMQTGWIHDGGNWYYLLKNGTMAKDTTIDGYVLDSNGAWDNTSLNNILQQSKEYEKIASDYIQFKGYNIINIKGQIDQYILNKDMLYGSIDSHVYSEIWGQQNVEPNVYFGREIKVYGFAVKNHSLEDIYNVNTNVYIMICDGKVIGGYSVPDGDIDGGCSSLDGKTLEEVTGLTYEEWYDEWETKYGNNTAKTNINSYKSIEDLPLNYNYNIAKANGDVVWSANTLYNIPKLDIFFENYENSKANVGDMIRITRYGDEGDPDITDLIVNKDSIKLIRDNTRDEFSSPKDRVIKEYKIVNLYKEYEKDIVYYYAESDQGEAIFLYYFNIYQL